MFSAVAIFQVRLAVQMASHLGIGLSEWMKIGKGVEDAEIPTTVAKMRELAELASEGNWFWAVARGVENKRPFKFSVFATHMKGKWVFDSFIGDERREPCFGAKVPCLYIPLWAIFEEVYVECKKLLGIGEKHQPGENA